MRWQLLNPEINSFTFRDMDRVFEIARRRARRRGVGPAARRTASRCRPITYPEFAERTFTNAMLVIRDGKIVFEDYRNRSTPGRRGSSRFSMAKTITSLLVGIALDEGKIALARRSGDEIRARAQGHRL